VACGGHPLPVILRAGGEVQELGAAGTLLGLVQRPELEDRTGELHPGDTLVLYTDGLTEAGAPAVVWEPEDLAQALRGAHGGTAQRIVDHLVAAAVGGQAEPRDDIAVVALKALA
jgi:serine phosphatase RsbU (regulator of sigma subunit)